MFNMPLKGYLFATIFHNSEIGLFRLIEPFVTESCAWV